MGRRFILAIDQGTTSSRALVVDAGGGIRGLGQQPITQHFPGPGLVEHDPFEIWSSMQAAIAAAFKAASVGSADIAVIGITNQRETVVLWDRRTGEPVANAIVWQDRRTAAACDAFRAEGFEAAFRAATGLTLDPYFSGTKLAWLLGSDAGLRRRAETGELAAGTVDSWLVWQLTGGRRHVTDYTNACRTLLFNIHSRRWDPDLCGILDIPEAILPEAVPSSSDFGDSDDGVLGASIPILAVAGDQQSALFGQACFATGQAKNTYGTGCFLLANAGPAPVISAARLLTSLGAGTTDTAPEYVLEGSVFVAGSLVQWLRDGLGIIRRSEDVEALAADVPDAGGVTIVPAFTGLGAPYWDPYARGTILGITRGTTSAHIARAALEAIALSNVELLKAIDASLPAPIPELRVDGGAARNNLLMQLQADLLGIPVVRPAETETTALGAAYLAGLAAGAWASRDEVAGLWRAERTFEPAMAGSERTERLSEWRRAVERSRDWARS